MLDTLTEDKTEVLVKKVTDSHPEETKRMQKWIAERVAASKSKPSAEVVMLTPVLAQLLLDCNPINRPINKRNAADLSNDIVQGRWQFNGESIVVSNTGVLLDGQHRCLEVVQSGTSIETVVVFGPSDQARFTIDTGRSKTIANFLSMKGRSFPSVLGAVASYHLQWKSRGYVIRGGPQMPTKTECIEHADNMRGVDLSVEFTSKMRKVRCHSALAFCHFLCSRATSRGEADEFFGAMIEDDGLKKDSPIKACLEKLRNIKGRGTEPNERIEVIFRCWNAWRLGQKRTVGSVKVMGGTLPKLEH